MILYIYILYIVRAETIIPIQGIYQNPLRAGHSNKFGNSKEVDNQIDELH